MIDRKEFLLSKIADNLLIRSSFEENLGLLHGRMGIILFFFHYASYTKNNLYQQVAEDLIHDFFEDIHNELSFDFKNGYCGIGWGFEYLAQHNFLSDNTGDLLEDIDLEIMKTDVYRLTDVSLTSGLSGILHYVLSRLSNKMSYSFFDEIYLNDLYEASKNVIRRNSTKESFDLANSFILYKEKGIINYSTDFLLGNLLSNNLEVDKIDHKKLGLIDGYAGCGLNLILNG